MKDKLFDLIFKNLKNPKLYIFILVLLIIVLILFPLIDANFLFYSRIEKRITNLQDILNIDQAELENNEMLLEEYNDILSEINSQKDNLFSSVLSSNSASKQDQTHKLIMFVCGGIFWWILAIVTLFMNTIKSVWHKIGASLMLFIFGGIIGGLGLLLPIVRFPLVNYIGYPVLQLTIIMIIAINSRKEKQTKKT